MRRKSTRNAQKTPDKAIKEETPTKVTRRSKRRKRSPSKSSDSEDEVLTVTKRAPLEETPDTTTKSHSPSDEETSQEPVWKVTSSEDAPKGEIQKLKICLTRPAPDSPEKSKSRRSKSSSHTEDDATSSEDKSSTSTRKTRASRGSPFIMKNDGLSSQEEDVTEDKKGKGKSKGKNKSKVEKSAHLHDPEIQTNNEISENAQVTPQSPSIDKPVDNENDYTKVEHDDANNDIENQRNSTEDNNTREIVKKPQSDDADSDNEPLSIIQKGSQQESSVPESDIEPQDKGSKIDDETVIKQQTVQSEPEELTRQQIHMEENAASEVSQKVMEESETSNLDSEEVKVCTKIVEKAEDSDIVDKESEISNSVPEDIPVTTVVTEEPETSNVDTIEPEDEETSPVSTYRDEVKRHKQVDTKERSEPTTPNEDSNASKVNEFDSEDVEMKDVGNGNKTEELEGQKIEESSPYDEVEQPEKPKAPRQRLIRKGEPLKSELETPKEDTSESQAKESQNFRIKPSKIKRKWNTSSVSSDVIKVDLEMIQNICPTIEFPEEPDLTVEQPKERRKSVTETKKVERKVSIEYGSETTEKPPYDKQVSTGSIEENEDTSNIIAFNRKISIVDDTASKLRPPPSPAKNPVSDVLYITNLVRPFTVKQLKELLERTGSIVEDGFWTDRIKSKCYIQYKSVEEAEATRNALHGVQWPIGNGKNLIIEYATVEDLEKAKNPPTPPPPAAAPVQELQASVKENVEPPDAKSRTDDKSSRESERKKRSDGPIREWDIGKKDLHGKSRSRSRDRSRKHRRSATPTDDFMTRKQRKVEESAPQKLMDDLFLKTKATPSIYWQPLSPEEIAMKQQQRLLRMEEHKRRMEENSRMRVRDLGRGGFRRRYD